MTVDTANRLGLSTLQSFAHVPHKIWSPPRMSSHFRVFEDRMIKTWSFNGSLWILSVPIQSYRSSTSASTAFPESPRCPTKPEPIMTCGCAGKPWVLKISVRLFEPGWSFPQDVMALPHASRVVHWFLQGTHLNRPSPRGIFRSEVLQVLESSGLDY